jgi:hypothetical protein
MEGIVNHNPGSTETLGRTCFGLEGALTAGDQDILFVKIAYFFDLDAAYWIQVVGSTSGFVAEEGIGFGRPHDRVGGVL